jgi:hypothetical protein
MSSGLQRTAALISCDIVGHSSVDGRDAQLARVQGINHVIDEVSRKHPGMHVLWASGGDGGHVLFLDPDWQDPALEAARSLYKWSQETEVPLRIAAHVGTIAIIDRALGGEQPVGDSINTAAQILTRGSAAGIVVSSQFRDAIGRAAGVEFHGERRLRLKHGADQELCLMSFAGLGHQSRWSDAIEVDQEQLLAAITAGSGFEAIYYAKRLLQVRSDMPAVIRALAALKPAHLIYPALSGDGMELNPVLGHLTKSNLRKIIDRGQLIERKYNEILCRQGDPGTTMFVILRGQIGVYGPENEGKPDPALPRRTLSEGQIVGELAFALNRPRTADLVSLGDTALLSFEYQEVHQMLGGSGEMIREFMNERALEHVSQNVPYLIGTQLGALPKESTQKWLGWLSTLQSDCHIISQESHLPLTLAGVRDQDQRRAGGGIYILASGHLQSQTTAGKELAGQDFPLLYVDLPGLVVAPDHEYMVVTGPAKIIFIALDAINQLPQEAHEHIVRELMRSLHLLYHYDAFISYNFRGDESIAVRWEQGLSDLGLRVFRDSAADVGAPYPERDGMALLDSLTMLVLVSPNADAKDRSDNWILKEVRFREKHFGRPRSRIIPIQLTLGDPQGMEITYAVIKADGREAEAIEDAAKLIRSIRNGEKESPFGLHRCGETQIT